MDEDEEMADEDEDEEYSEDEAEEVDGDDEDAEFDDEEEADDGPVVVQSTSPTNGMPGGAVYKISALPMES